MKIIIDIPGYMYDWFDNGFQDDDDFEKLWKIIKDGQIINEGKEIQSPSATDDMDKSNAT